MNLFRLNEFWHEIIFFICKQNQTLQITPDSGQMWSIWLFFTWEAGAWGSLLLQWTVKWIISVQQLSPEPCLCRITFIQGTHNTKQHFIKQNIRTLLFNAKHITFISLESILNSSLCCCCCCCCCFSFCCYCFQGFSFHLLVSFFQATSLRACLNVEPKGGDTAVVLSNFYRVRTATLPHILQISK